MKRVIKSSFFKHIMIVVSGTAIAQVISIGISPILTRLYSAEAFGLMGLFASVTAVLGAFSNGRYDLAVMLSPDEKESHNLLWLSCLISCTVASFFLLLTPFSSFFADLFLQTPEFSPYFVLVPFMLLLTGCYKSFDQWICRQQFFRLMSISTVTGTISSNIFMLVGGVVGAGPLMLILGSIINQLSKILVMLRGVREQIPQVIADYNWREVKQSACDYSDFPKYRATQDTLNALSQNAPSLMLAYFFSPAHVGFFWLANRVLRLPGALISEAIRKVFYQKASQLSNEKQPLFPLALKVTCGLTFIGLFPLGLLILLAPELFEWVFGSGWRVSGEYAQWVSLWAFCGFINVPAIVIAPILGKQKFMLGYEITTTFLKVSSLLMVSLAYGNALLSIATFSIIAAVGNVFVVLSILYFCKKDDLVSILECK